LLRSGALAEGRLDPADIIRIVTVDLEASR
jgi:hypothetical protein